MLPSLEDCDVALQIAGSFTRQHYVLCNCPDCWPEGEPLIERISINFHPHGYAARHWGRFDVSAKDHVAEEPLIPGRHDRFTARQVILAGKLFE